MTWPLAFVVLGVIFLITLAMVCVRAIIGAARRRRDPENHFVLTNAAKHYIDDRPALEDGRSVVTRGYASTFLLPVPPSPTARRPP
jgi:hypothetical protein